MRILFTPYSGGSIAHIVRSLAIADEMRDRGHEVLFTTTRSKKTFVQNAGYDVYRDGHADVNLNDASDQSVNYFRNNRDLFIDWLGDEVGAARHFRPHVIVNSPSFFGPLSGISTGTPYVALLNAQWLAEFRGLIGLARSEQNFSHSAIRAFGQPIINRKLKGHYMPEIAAYCRALNIPYAPKRRTELHCRGLVLIPGVADFEPIDCRAGGNVHYLGPLFWRGFENSEPLLYAKFSAPDRPLVYISLGGSVYRRETYTDLTSALAKQDKWNVILSLGPNFPRSDFGADLPHLRIRTYVPGLKTCEHADAIINTGGHGTVMQSLWHGKPLVTIPHNIDQATIAARIEELGLGLNLNRANLLDCARRHQYYRKATKVSWQSVIQATDRVLREPSFRIKATEFQKQLRHADNAPQRAADLIEDYANSSARS